MAERKRKRRLFSPPRHGKGAKGDPHLLFEVWEEGEEFPGKKKKKEEPGGYLLLSRERVIPLTHKRIRSPVYSAGLLVCARCDSAIAIFILGKLDCCPVCGAQRFYLARLNPKHPQNRIFFRKGRKKTRENPRRRKG